MKFWKPAALTLALAMAYPSLASAQSNAAMAKELKALQDRITELEKKLAEKPAAAAVAPAPAEKQWGMTPEQLQDFNRIAVKTEATEDNLAAWGYKGLTVSGYIEPTYIYNKRQHRAGFQFLNNQSDGFFYDTSYMGTASIDFTKETDSGTKWKLTLAPNRGVGAVISGGIVQEASVSVPLTDLSTRLIAGQIPDWSGYEYQQPTLNPFTTHNLLYDFTLPTSYTGAGMNVKTGKWEFKGVVANVNTTIRQAGEKSPAIAYRGDYSYSEYAGFGFAGLHGKTPNFNTGTSTVAHLLEADGYYTRGDWTFQGQVGAGKQKQGAITPEVDGTYRDANWWGLSGLAGYAITPRLQGLIRADYIHNTKNGGGLFGYNGYSAVCEPAVGATDCDGVPAGAVVYGNDGRNGLGPDLASDLDRGANRYALSLGMKFAFNPSTTFKAEYRLDGASKPVFFDVKSLTYQKTNQLLGASVVVFF